MTTVHIFLSTVSAEFRSYRDALRHDLDRPNVTVKVQEDFIATGTETLDKLDDYLRQCDAVIHLVGDMTGTLAQAPSLNLIRTRYLDLAERLPPLRPCLETGAPALSYTQWEAWLALYHHKILIIAVPENGAVRDEKYALIEEQRNLQQAHLARLAAFERYPEIIFSSMDRLTVAILRSKLYDVLARAGTLKKPANLPFASIGRLFKGREIQMNELNQSLGAVPETNATPVVARVLSGLGGVGKTRLALEYAWQRGADYSARLFVSADSVGALQRNLAALCRTVELNAQQEADESKQRDAVLNWLNQHPGWLLILDNVDTEEVAAAVETLVPQLFGGHLLVTSRMLNWSGSLTALALDTLSTDAATEFLLERTDTRRRRLSGDNAQARILAQTLDGLALALEQASAYICVHRLTFQGYLEKWRKQRDVVLDWFDPRQMQYPKSVAMTWQATFDQLDEPARRLLQRLAWLSPEPIPESLLDVAVGEEESGTDPLIALAQLESYSLVKRDADNPSFSIHRLVQEIARRQTQDPEHIRLKEALRWLDAAFIGDPTDVRSWPVLNPLLPHAQAVIEHADDAGITVPAVWLISRLGVMYLEKSLYAKAEPLLRRALSIAEASFGANRPDVAIDLNNLAQLLQTTNRLDEAEPLMRRALSIYEESFGVDHPNFATILNNLAQLLKATDRLTEAEPLMRQSLAITERCFGADHPNVAIVLNNLALLLYDTNRLDEAESLMRRALFIDERSYGANHPCVASDLNSLATLLLRVADVPLTEVEPLLRRALIIAEASFGAENLKVATYLNNLAQLLKATDRLVEAESLMRRAFTIIIRNLGKEHPYFRMSWENYIRLLQELGQTESEIQAKLENLFG